MDEYGCSAKAAMITHIIAVLEKAPGLDVRIMGVINMDSRVEGDNDFI
jgi:hypothetical protein